MNLIRFIRKVNTESYNINQGTSPKNLHINSSTFTKSRYKPRLIMSLIESALKVLEL